jgi:1-acyl-sn-glycerol-3-phosphate acyltransferase
MAAGPLRVLTDVYTRAFQQLRVLRPCTIPPAGPAILACNHTSGLDPVVLQTCSRRIIVWMMAREYYEMPSLHWFFRTIEAIPVDRSGQDTSATRAAMRALRDGRVVGLFPEGKIEEGRAVLPFQPGVALLATRTGAPVCTAAIDIRRRGVGMLEAYYRPQAPVITFGEVFQPPGKSHGRDAVEQFAGRLEEEIRKLLAEICHATARVASNQNRRA